MKRSSLALLVWAAIMASVPSGASAATTVGETFLPTVVCGSGHTHLQTGSPGARYVVPTTGVITSWSFQAGVPDALFAAPPQLKFKLGRQAGGDNYTVVGESGVVTPAPGVLNTFPLQLRAEAGDVIGLYPVTPGYCFRVPAPGYVVSAAFDDDVTPFETRTFSPQPAVQDDVSANLETTPCGGMPPTIAGTAGDDTLAGTPEPDVIIGLEGKDEISGLGGDDRICGGSGKDTLKGGSGADKLLGQSGKDALKGGGGRDTCKGGKGRDRETSC